MEQTFLVSPAAPGCTAVSSALTCAFSLNAPIGVDAFTVTANSIPGSAALAKGTTTQTIVANQVNTVSVTMSGVPIKGTMSASPTFIPNATRGTLPFSISLEDYDGDVIIGPFTTPVTISGASSGGSAWGTFTCDGRTGATLSLSSNPASCTINSSGTGSGVLTIGTTLKNGPTLAVPYAPTFQTLYQFSKILPSASLATWIALGGDIAISEVGQGTIARVPATSYLTYGTDVEYPVPSGAQPGAIVACSVRGGEFCFAEPGAIGILSATGSIVEIPTPTSGAAIGGLTLDTHKNVWFSEPGNGKIGLLTNTTIREFDTGIAGSAVTGLSTDLTAIFFTDPATNSVGFFDVPPSTSTPPTLYETAVPTAHSNPSVVVYDEFGESNASNLGAIYSNGPPNVTAQEYPADDIVISITDDWQLTASNVLEEWPSLSKPMITTPVVGYKNSRSLVWTFDPGQSNPIVFLADTPSGTAIVEASPNR